MPPTGRCLVLRADALEQGDGRSGCSLSQGELSYRDSWPGSGVRGHEKVPAQLRVPGGAGRLGDWSQANAVVIPVTALLSRSLFGATTQLIQFLAAQEPSEPQ